MDLEAGSLYKSTLFAFFVLLCLGGRTDGHGRLWEPPARSSMWRRGYNTSININDNELSCGGFTNQWIVNGGRCGVCGDPFQQPQPRDNENGGLHASGLVARTYPVGEVVEVVIGLTANHGGYFEFKLCPLFDPIAPESQDCMDQHRLAIHGSDGGGYQFHILDHQLTGEVRISVVLPRDLRCQHCVMQWKYRTGTRWGCDAKDQCGHGLGPQEEFYGCADIAILDVPSTIHLVPKQTADQDKVGLNDLGSKHHRKLDKSPATSLTKTRPVVKYVAHKSDNHNGTLPDSKPDNFTIKSPELTAQSNNPNGIENLRDDKFMENLLLRAIRTYYDNNNMLEINGPTCTAIAKYQQNPIINEWCRKTCPEHPGLCPTSICECTNSAYSDTTVPSTITEQYTRDLNTLRTFAKDLIMNHNRKYVIEEGVSNISPIDNLFATLPVPKDFTQSPKVNFLRTNLYKEIDRGLSDKSGSGDMNSKTDPLTAWTGYTSPLPRDHTDAPPKNSIDVLSKSGNAGSKFTCTASKQFAHNEFMANWCFKNCSFGFCPRMVCTCSS